MLIIPVLSTLVPQDQYRGTRVYRYTRVPVAALLGSMLFNTYTGTRNTRGINHHTDRYISTGPVPRYAAPLPHHACLHSQNTYAILSTVPVPVLSRYAILYTCTYSSTLCTRGRTRVGIAKNIED